MAGRIAGRIAPAGDRSWMRFQATHPVRARSATDLAVTCWCETAFVLVPAAEIQAGRTRSCGRKACKAP